MHSHAQVFFHFGTTLRTLLRSSSSIDEGKELAPLPAHIFGDRAKLPKRGIKHMLAKHPFSTNPIVQVFHEDHIGTITKCMSLFEMKVFASAINRVVHPGNFEALFLVIGGPSKFSTQSAL